LDKLQYDWDKKIEVIHEEAKLRLELKRCSKEHKKLLFKSVRYSYMKHEDLFAMSSNPVFELAKDYIVEGMSVLLDTTGMSAKKELNININPRINFE
jgi:hypothetical protein